MDDQSSVQTFTDYSLQVLQLCRLLWGPVQIPENIQIINRPYFEDQRRRQMLSEWLHQCILSQPRQQQVKLDIQLVCPSEITLCFLFSHGLSKIVNCYLVVCFTIVWNLLKKKVIFD